MGKFARRGTAVGAVALAGALALGTAASADPVDGSPVDIDGNPEVSNPSGPSVYRFAGDDRITTAVRAAERTNLPWGDTVIVANSSVFADALAATTYADAIDAPVLLNTPGDNVNDRVEDYIEARNSEDGIGDAPAVARVVVLGGTDVFTDDFIDDLGDDVTVERVAGINRYETAVELAERTEGEGGVTVENVFLASGTEFPDALTAGAAAAGNDGVVLLTRGDEGLPEVTFDAVTDFTGGAATSVAIGGPAADAAAEGFQGSPVETRLDVVGDDRYETAVAVADEFLSDGASEAQNLVVTSGENFPDAVVGGAYAANVDGALLLTKQDRLNNATRDFIEGDTLDLDNVFVFGGQDSVSRSVSNDIANIYRTN